MKMKPLKLSLISRLILAIILGIGIGLFLPTPFVQILITASSIFSSFLKFVIPLIILAFVIDGISDLKAGASKLLGITTLISYISTIGAALITYLIATNTFKYFISAQSAAIMTDNSSPLEPIFQLPIPPIMDVTSAIALAFILGLGISKLKNTNKGETLYYLFKDFKCIIEDVLRYTIVPLLPLYIAGTFANIAYTGQVVHILKVFWKVLLLVILMHWGIMFLQFLIAGIVSKKNPFKLIKIQLPAYITALGTQSSVATLPINLQVSEKMGISKHIRDFVLPLCSTIHLSGSITSILSFSIAILMLNGMDYSLSMMLPYILMLGITMIAAPGAPGGAVMAALPLLAMIGISPDGVLASLIIALHITQDGFGTAANISGDNAIACIVDTIHKES